METDVTKRLFTVEDYYRMARAGILRPEDRVELIVTVEVSDKSLLKDQKIKLPKYAEAGISEYWVADLRHNILYVYRSPNGQIYDAILTFGPGDSVSVLAFPDINFRVDELLSTDCDIPVDEL